MTAGVQRGGGGGFILEGKIQGKDRQAEQRQKNQTRGLHKDYTCLLMYT